MAEPIRFKDMLERNDRERDRIVARIRELEADLKAGITTPAGGAGGSALTPAQVKQLTLEQLKELPPNQQLKELKRRRAAKVVDKAFTAVAADVSPDARVEHDAGLMPSQNSGGPPGSLTATELEIAAVYGILIRDNQNPALERRFAKAISVARGDFKADKALFEQVLPILVRVGDKRGKAGATPTDDVNTADLASVVRTLSQQGVGADDLYLEVKASAALDGLTAGDGRQAPSTIDILLPDLEEEVDVEIIVDNLHAMQAIYFSAMLEELKLFQVADKLVDLFNQGVLPLGKGRSGDLLFDYWRKSNERFTEVERLNLYARSFGFPGGEPMQAPNRDFNDLWLRFVSAVSSFSRQLSLDNLLQAQIAASVSQEQVRKSGRDLAANLSLYGYGVAYFAATSLQEQIRDIIELLSSDEIKSAYGSRDLWQVVDQVASLELNGARSTVRYRTMATSGATIIRWLAKNRGELAAISTPVIDEAAVRRGSKSRRPTVDPSDRDVVDAAEQWLAVTGTPDAQIEQYAQPVESGNATSAPNWLGGVVQDALASAGVGPDGGTSA
jgi:hypothetical protein